MYTQNWSTLLHSCFNNEVRETLLLITTKTDVQKPTLSQYLALVRNRAQHKMAYALGNNCSVQSLLRLLAFQTSIMHVD
jgi:hypothetical protein